MRFAMTRRGTDCEPRAPPRPGRADRSVGAGGFGRIAADRRDEPTDGDLAGRAMRSADRDGLVDARTLVGREHANRFRDVAGDPLASVSCRLAGRPRGRRPRRPCPPTDRRRRVDPATGAEPWAARSDRSRPRRTPMPVGRGRPRSTPRPTPAPAGPRVVPRDDRSSRSRRLRVVRGHCRSARGAPPSEVELDVVDHVPPPVAGSDPLVVALEQQIVELVDHHPLDHQPDRDAVPGASDPPVEVAMIEREGLASNRALKPTIENVAGERASGRSDDVARTGPRPATRVPPEIGDLRVEGLQENRRSSIDRSFFGSTRDAGPPPGTPPRASRRRARGSSMPARDDRPSPASRRARTIRSSVEEDPDRSPSGSRDRGWPRPPLVGPARSPGRGPGEFGRREQIPLQPRGSASRASSAGGPSDSSRSTASWIRRFGSR